MKKIKDYIEVHPFLFWSAIISTILGIIPFFIFLCYEELRFCSWVFLVPIIFVFIILKIANRTFIKHPSATKIVTFILGIFIILFVQIFVAGCFYILATLWGICGSYTDVKYYKKSLNKLACQTCIEHFPQEIPKNAKNVQLYQNYGNWHGNEGITLKFQIDNDYINKQINKNRYVNIQKYYENDSSLNKAVIYYNNGVIKTDGCIAHLIDDKEHTNKEFASYKYSYGICVNNDKNEIIYFYSNP